MKGMINLLCFPTLSPGALCYLLILCFSLFLFNQLLSLYALGKMVKKVCPCNQLCSNYFTFGYLWILIAKLCCFAQRHTVLSPLICLKHSIYSLFLLICILHYCRSRLGHPITTAKDNFDHHLMMYFLEINHEALAHIDSSNFHIVLEGTFPFWKEFGCNN